MPGALTSPTGTLSSVRIGGRRLGRASFCALLVLAWASATYGQALYTIYLSPTGNDGNNGTSGSPVLTLTRAHQLIQAALTSNHRNAEVRVAPGTYYGQRVVWTFTMPSNSIVIRRWPDNSSTPRPVFQGIDGTGTWFTLNAGAGQYTNITLRYLWAENYRAAVVLNGNREDLGDWNGNNTIYGCYFYHIGNYWHPSAPWSSGAVVLVNSDNNLIQNNHFVGVANVVPNQDSIHAVYLAHSSDWNTVLNNRIKSVSGDPIRVRDYSNFNYIANNRFIQTGHYAYSEWLCLWSEFGHCCGCTGNCDCCTKCAPECFSWENEFRDNFLDGTWTCATLYNFDYDALYSMSQNSGCWAPPFPGAKRLYTSGATVNLPPCTSE